MGQRSVCSGEGGLQAVVVRVALVWATSSRDNVSGLVTLEDSGEGHILSSAEGDAPTQPGLPWQQSMLLESCSFAPELAAWTREGLPKYRYGRLHLHRVNPNPNPKP